MFALYIDLEKRPLASDRTLSSNIFAFLNFILYKITLESGAWFGPDPFSCNNSYSIRFKL